MSSKNTKLIQTLRISSQILFLFLFYFLLIRTGKSNIEPSGYVDIFFYFDPLIFLLNIIATQAIQTLFLLSIIPVFLTLVFGRFFCGWVCPFGAINQFFSWIFKRSKKKNETINKNLLNLKYIILILIVIMAIMGTHIGGWLDPLSILSRSSTIAVNPAVNYSIEHSLKEGANDKSIVKKGLKPIYEFTKKNILKTEQRVYFQSILIGMIFLLIIFLNFFKRRFFCNYICPLGALYGLIAKFSFFNLKVNENKCKSCNLCSNNCTYNGSPFKDYMKSECLVCFNCLKDCPENSIEIKFAVPKKENRTSIDLGRRRVVGSILSGIFISAFPRISNITKSKRHKFLRPPGSVSEKQFLQKCIRCGECMHVCPTNLIQPCFLESGIEGIWTPVLKPNIGYCEYECNRCTQICPTNAIEKLSIEEKKKFKIGTAVIDRNRCYTYVDGYNCGVCEEHCPVPDKAIRFREVEVWNFEGKLKKVKQIYVVTDLCIGCGICENVCPRSDHPAIYITAEEEQREFNY